MMASSLRNAGRTAKRWAERGWYGRGGVPIVGLPIPWRLPYGAWFLAHPDAMGARVVGYRLAGHPYEEAQWKFVSRVLRPGMCFCDVGANQGFYTLLAANLVGASGRVLAFEPAATEVRKLRRNIRLNGFRNVLVENSAVAAAAGLETFHLVRGHQGSWSSLRPPADDVMSKVDIAQVRTVQLDDYVLQAGLPRVDVLKIDVEGAELSVLEGARRILADDGPIVLAEIEERRTRQWGYAAEDIIEFMRGQQYEWYAVTERGGLAPFGARDRQAWDNLVAVPVSRAESLAQLMEDTC